MQDPKAGRVAGRRRAARRSRFSAASRDEAEAGVDDGDLGECSSASCRSCTAVLLADCVALTCCPCAVVSLLALALVKVPFGVGRRCIRLLRKRRALSQKRVRDVGGGGGVKGKEKVGFGKGLQPCRERSARNGDQTDGMGIEMGELTRNGGLGSGCEAEGVMLELYQIGHWGFGRVSFSETP